MKQTHILSKPIYIENWATVAGELEGQGALAGKFDISLDDNFYDKKTWEQAESKMQNTAVKQLLLKAGVTAGDIDFLISGDLQAQCCAATFGLAEFNIPFYGIYGACSNMAQAMSMGALLLNGSIGEKAICGTSSHFSSAEREFRFPNDYGAFRKPTAQWTVTGSGFCLLTGDMPEAGAPTISAVTTGKIVDYGQTDANDMGGAMAPSAADTLAKHFQNTSSKPDDYAMILTGDLGAFGAGVLRDLLAIGGFPLGDNYLDCGNLIYSEDQDVDCGGSGCACSSLVLCADVLPKLKSGEIKGKVLFCGTGALLSPVSAGQGASIPAIAHLLEISN